jgi:V/A-type H+-transporting ATPase subunit I
MFVFSRASMGIIAGIKSILATFIFDVIGGFSDMISYIRIPIVGLVTVVLGSLFNMMVGASILALPATLLGHVFGMVLALMGVLIHATRLKSMEFSNHASMDWNGEWYKPFAGKETKQWI